MAIQPFVSVCLHWLAVLLQLDVTYKMVERMQLHKTAENSIIAYTGLVFV